MISPIIVSLLLYQYSYGTVIDTEATTDSLKEFSAVMYDLEKSCNKNLDSKANKIIESKPMCKNDANSSSTNLTTLDIDNFHCKIKKQNEKRFQ